MTLPPDAAGGAHEALGAGREFDLVRRMLAGWGALARGIGDDCAVLDLPPGARLCVSTDSSIEGVHFRRDWLTPEEIGYRAATAALSDLAAMAAEPLGLLLALGLPEAWVDSAVAVASGVGEAAERAGAAILGGDTTGAPALVLGLAVLGSAERPVRRDGARPGDRVYVTGRLGGPRAALRLLERGAPPPAALRARFARPVARIAEARWLAARGVRALIDVSDGLTADLQHVAAASGVRVVLDVDRVPVVDGAGAADALASGEEYELALTSSEVLDTAAFGARFGVELTEIGRVTRGESGVEAWRDDARVDLTPGYDHLSG